MLQALLVTLFAFILIFILDKIADLPCTGEAADREVKAFVGPLSLLIGFAWKQSFVSAVTTIMARPLQTLSMAVVLALVVVPAWRWYILPVVMEEEVKRQERRQARGAVAEGKAAPLLAGQNGGPYRPAPLAAPAAASQAP